MELRPIWVGDKSNKEKRLCGHKVKYPDGIGYTLSTYADDDGDGGLAFDFPEDQMLLMKELLQKLDEAEPEIYPVEELKKLKEWEEETNEKEKKLLYKIHNFLSDIGIQVTPFDWGFHMSMKKIIRNKQLAYQMCDGIKFGPIMVTW